jgi:hypothetical protein
MRIERLSWRGSRYAVSGGSVWEGRRFREPLSADDGGRRLEFSPDGRKRFVLLADGQEIASAARAGREWIVKADHATYVLRRQSRWRSTLEVVRRDQPLGLVRQVRAPKGGAVSVELPDDVPALTRAFIGFVFLTLRNRAAASSGAAGSVAATSA